MAKHPGGRPTVMTADTIAKLEYAFSIGCTDEEACLHADIGMRTLYDYQRDNEEFSHRKALLKQKTVLKARKVVDEQLDSGDKQTAQWLLERKKKDEFGTRNEVTGADGAPIQTSVEVTFVDAKKD